MSSRALVQLVLLIAAAIAIVQLPLGVAVYTKSPSGVYIDLVAHRVKAYDNYYDSTADLGPSLDAYNCPWPGATPQTEQCGQCTYLGAEWHDSDAQYTKGRCASVLAAVPTAVTYRGDVRVMSDPTDHWNYTAYVKYYQNSGQQVGPARDILRDADCTNTVITTALTSMDVAFCSVPPESKDITARISALGADYYCVYSEIYHRAEPNIEPDSRAWVCP